PVREGTVEDLLPSADQLLASAITYLIQGEQNGAALTLLFCEATVEPIYDNRGNFAREFRIFLVGPRLAYDAYRRTEDGWDEDGGIQYTWQPVEHAVRSAFDAVAPPGTTVKDITIRVQLVDVQPGWREELQEIAHGRRVHNQGVELRGREI